MQAVDPWLSRVGRRPEGVPVGSILASVTGCPVRGAQPGPPMDLAEAFMYWTDRGFSGDVYDFAALIFAPLATRHTRRRMLSAPVFDPGVSWEIQCREGVHRVSLSPTGALYFHNHTPEDRNAARALSVLGEPLPPCLSEVEMFSSGLALQPRRLSDAARHNVAGPMTAAYIRYVRRLLSRYTPPRTGPGQSPDVKLLTTANRVLKALGYRRVRVHRSRRVSVRSSLGLPLKWMQLYHSDRCAVVLDDQPYLVLKAKVGPRRTRLTLLEKEKDGSGMLRTTEVSLPTSQVQYRSCKPTQERRVKCPTPRQI